MNVPFSLWYINKKSWKWVCKCVSFFNQKSDPRIHFKDCLPQMMACLLVNFLLVILGLPTQKKKATESIQHKSLPGPSSLGANCSSQRLSVHYPLRVKLGTCTGKCQLLCIPGTQMTLGFIGQGLVFLVEFTFKTKAHHFLVGWFFINPSEKYDSVKKWIIISPNFGKICEN